MEWWEWLVVVGVFVLIALFWLGAGTAVGYFLAIHS